MPKAYSLSLTFFLLQSGLGWNPQALQRSSCGMPRGSTSQHSTQTPEKGRTSSEECPSRYREACSSRERWCSSTGELVGASMRGMGGGGGRGRGRGVGTHSVWNWGGDDSVTNAGCKVFSTLKDVPCLKWDLKPWLGVPASWLSLH